MYMLFRSTFFIMFFCILGLSSWAQDGQQPLVIRGKVYDQADTVPVAYINVFNLRTKTGGTTADDGSFAVYALPGDTLRFTGLSFQDYLVLIDLQNPPTNIKVFMYRASYPIKTVIVRPLSIMDAPAAPDLKRLKTDLPPPPVNKGAAPGSGAAGSVLSFGKDKNQRNLEKQQEEIAKWGNTEVINKKYNKEVVKRLTGLPDSLIEDFMKNCYTQSEFLETASDYDIAVHVKSCYNNYLIKHPELKKK
jgi:hypothetical protein